METEKSITNKERECKEYKIEKADTRHVNIVAGLLGVARQRMVEAGNSSQWPQGYPPLQKVENGIEAGYTYLIWHGEMAVATFTLMPGPDPAYSVIRGKWLDDIHPYCVIHRLAALPSERGIFGMVLGYCSALAQNLRVDTHRDNRPMRHLLEKNGFKYCGIVYVDNGTERMAYQRLTATGT